MHCIKYLEYLFLGNAEEFNEIGHLVMSWIYFLFYMQKEKEYPSLFIHGIIKPINLRRNEELIIIIEFIICPIRTDKYHFPSYHYSI